MADKAKKGRTIRELDHWNGKLTDVQVEEIRQRYDPQAFPKRGGGMRRSNAVELAAEFGVSRGHISNLVTRNQRKRVGNGK